MGPIFARIRENMDNRQEARQARQEARHERHSTKHDIPTDTPLAEEKILNTDRTEIHKLIADAVKIQLSEKTASKLETEQSARERLANVSALDYVGKVVRPTLVQQAENPNRVLPYGPPSNRVEHTEQRSPALEQPFATRTEPPKMLDIIKTEKAIFDERLKEIEQKMEEKMEEKMAALEKKLDERNKKLTEINQSLSKENLDLIIRLNALEQPVASIPATNTPAPAPETKNPPAPTNVTSETDWNKLVKGCEEFIANGMKVKPPYWTNNSNLTHDSNSEVFKKFFENAQKISGSKLSMDSPDGLAWIKKVIDEKLVPLPALSQEVPKRGNSNANDAPNEAKKTVEPLEAEIEKKRAERAAELKTEKSERNSKR